MEEEVCTCCCGRHSQAEVIALGQDEGSGVCSDEDECPHEAEDLDDSVDSIDDHRCREEAETAMASLQLQIRALKRYKANYQLLCGQLGELNAQIGLQLQRHEADVAALQATIADLQAEKLALIARVDDTEQALAVQKEIAKQDQEYSEHVHHQLSTATELLKSTEARLEEQQTNFITEIDRMKVLLAAGNDESEEYQAIVNELQKELQGHRNWDAEAKEQEELRRRREKSKRQREIEVRDAKLRAMSDDMETQRSILRATKKQLSRVQTDNDALRKQLVNVKRDGAHLSDIIDSQRDEQDVHTERLLRVKKAKKQLARRVAMLSQDLDQLRSELVDIKEELIDRNNELESCRSELRNVRIKLRQSNESLGGVRTVNEQLVQQIKTYQQAQDDRCYSIKAEDKEQRDRHCRKEFGRVQELLDDNQQRSNESSKDVHKLRQELLSVRNMLYGCKAQPPTDQWDETMRNSIRPETPVGNSALMGQVRAFGV